jgi:YVTN family beta-propeller protein
VNTQRIFAEQWTGFETFGLRSWPRSAAIGALIALTIFSLAGCGGAGSVPPPPQNPSPSVANGSLSPSSAVAGSAAFTLTVNGSNFISSSVVQWNGSPRTTTFVSGTSLQAAITAADIVSAGAAMVTVMNPAPGGGTSGALTFTIKVPPPVITFLTPSSAVMGGTAFTLTVTGTRFVSASSVQWNGSPRTTTFVSSTELQATITGADIAAIGTAKVTVVNPVVNGGPSTASTFFVGSSGGANFATITLNLAVKDIVYDPVNTVFYLSVASTDPNHPNTVSVLDPSTDTITSSVPAGSNPNALAISDDSQFLYAGIDGAGAVQRFVLPSLAKDITYSLGGTPNIALGLEVAPGAPHTAALAVGNPNVSPSAGGVTIFDDANPRPTKAQNGLFSSIQWGADATTMFSANDESTGFDFYTLAVNSSGVALNQDFSNRFSSFSNKIHFDPVTKLVYGDDGQVVDSNGNPAGVFDSAAVFSPSSAVMTPDSNLGTAFFVGQTSSVGGAATFTIQSFDLAHFTPVTSISVTGVTGNPLRLVRWGQNGLAFNTSSGQVFLVGGNFISPAPPFVVTPPPTPATPPTPAANAPTIASLTPSSAVAGASGFTMNVTGTNFSTSSTVQWNGSPRATVFVSSTQLTATITSVDISAAGTASISVLNPSSSGGVSAASTFFIGTTGGASSTGTFAVTVLNQASKDIVFDLAQQVIYLSVPGTVAGGNTVAVLDTSSLKIVGNQFAGSDPDLLAISDDNQFLYVAIDGSSSVQRFTLPSLGTDIKYSLGAHSFFGPYTALDLQVAPGAPRTSAISLGNVGFSPRAQGGIIIFDDAIARPTKAPGFGGGAGSGLFDSLQWGINDTQLFAANTDDSGFDFYSLSVTSTGVTLSQDFPGAGDGSRIHFNAATNLVYCDNGRVINPSNGTSPGSFSAGTRMVPDATLNEAFFVTVSGTTATIQSFNLTTRAAIAAVSIPNITGNPQRLIRWGQNGLAFNTDAGEVVLVGGNFVH